MFPVWTVCLDLWWLPSRALTRSVNCVADMKDSLFVTLLYLVITVWAGGYQRCLERVWLYNALLVDHEFNGEAGRTIGYQCKGRDWDSVNMICNQNKWQAIVSLLFPLQVGCNI